jgi:hypothetical protein
MEITQLSKELNDLQIRIHTTSNSFLLEVDELRSTNHHNHHLVLNINVLRYETLQSLLPFLNKHKADIQYNDLYKRFILSIHT